MKSLIPLIGMAACLGVTGWGGLAAAAAERASGGLPDDPLARAEANREIRMEWWRDAKFGMFIHWGLYAIPGDDWPGVPKGRYSEWLMSRGVPPEDYRALAPKFQPRSFDPDEWIRLAQSAGMKYIVLTAKHHEGFALWGTRTTGYNSVRGTPFGRDVIGDVSAACARAGMKFGVYYSILDWDHPDYLPRHPWDGRPAESARFERYLAYMNDQLRELTTKYGPLAELWFDGGWEHSAEDLRSADLFRAIYQAQPAIVINDRAQLPGDFSTPEQEIPATPPARPWETCLTINGSWGFKKDDENWKPTTQLVRCLIEVVSRGGNLLLNVGPDADGKIPAVAAQRLREMGRWLNRNGDAIYGTQASLLPAIPSWGRSTTKIAPDGAVRMYLHVFDWPPDGRLAIPELKELPARVTMPAFSDAEVSADVTAEGLVLRVPAFQHDDYATVIALDYPTRPALPVPPAPNPPPPAPTPSGDASAAPKETAS